MIRLDTEPVTMIIARTAAMMPADCPIMGILAAAAAMGASEAAKSAAGSKPTAAVDRAV